jgi:glycosyltransferase involved in cell wall biosynthesis
LHNTLISPVFRFKKQEVNTGIPVISSSEGELWNTDDTAANWILTAGKVQNLRIAAAKLNGIEVKANAVFSFWKHIGYPSRQNGYVVGREIREGCIVPTIAGGLCQLSNALYDAALKAGFEIIERHAHTRVIKGSLAESGRDATVKWNYVDLRFRALYDFKIAVSLSADSLLVQFNGHKDVLLTGTQNTIHIPATKLNDCYSCGNTTCFKHPGSVISNMPQHSTAFILDEKWPEFEQYVRSAMKDGDFFIVPFIPRSRFKILRYVWHVGNKQYSFALVALQRALSLRIAAAKKKNIPFVYQHYDERIVRHIKRAIPIECTHIVITQNLLPYAWEQALLGGRTFDVLMTRLPMETLQQKLDKAHHIHPESKTLDDFRAGPALVSMENAALTHASRIITPHHLIASIFNNKSIKLDWHLPKASGKHYSGDKILFPASALARKGAYEMRRLATELSLKLVITGSATEKDDFWLDADITIAQGDIFKDIALVVLPSYIEHQPRMLLKALANNIPVIATDSCGIPPSGNISIIPAGDYGALKLAVLTVLGKNKLLSDAENASTLISLVHSG